MNYYRDGNEMLKKLSNAYNVTQKHDQDFQTSPASIEHSIHMLHKKFKDFEHIFTYYLTSTKEFFSQNPSKE